jgi:demethylmenaquinone methyltransferase/2-methoxy-6-polyprenyl-1,4-benzoquinol methylase
VFQKLADAIMLFYDEAEADRMFHDAGFSDVTHRVMGPSYDPDIAITTLARVPEDDDATGDAATTELEAEADA